MKLLLLGTVLAASACVKSGQAPARSTIDRPAPPLRDLCTDSRFNSLCTPVQMPGPVQIDINTAGRHAANPPAFS